MVFLNIDKGKGSDGVVLWDGWVGGGGGGGGRGEGQGAEISNVAATCMFETFSVLFVCLRNLAFYLNLVSKCL